MKKYFLLALLGFCSPLLLAASYGIFSPGGALSGTWNSQNVNVGAGSPFVTGLLPAANLGTGTATGAVTWSATQSFSKQFSSGNSGAIVATSGAPRIEINTTSAASDEGLWSFVGSNSALATCAVNDARTSTVCPFQFNRLLGTAVSNGQYFVPILGTTASFATDASSTLLAGDTSAASAFFIAQISTATANLGAQRLRSVTTGIPTQLVWNADTSGDNIFVRFDTEGSATTRGSITYNRGAGLTAYNVTSSRNLKDNIRDADPAGQAIDAIRIRKYEFRETGQTVPHWVIAEELRPVYPLASDGEQVDVTKLVPLLIKEVQSLRLRVRDLEAASLNSRSAANETTYRPNPRLDRDLRHARAVGSVYRMR